MTDKDALTGAPHAMVVVVLFETLKAGLYGGVFFGLVGLGAEGVVAERVQTDAFGLVGGEGLGENGPVGSGLVLEHGTMRALLRVRGL